jgi:demethoxyubiquinone hydroxylase (CLK1/Coq7/Cat5 family)
MSKLTISERAQLKEVCKETLIRKFTQKEAHIYVNSKLQGFNISFDYVQKVRNQISKNTKEELLRLEKDQYALIQSLFFDRKDELEHMQKVCWSIIAQSVQCRYSNQDDRTITYNFRQAKPPIRIIALLC